MTWRTSTLSPDNLQWKIVNHQSFDDQLGFHYLPSKTLNIGVKKNESNLSRRFVRSKKIMMIMPNRSKRANCILNDVGRHMASILLPSRGGMGIRLNMARTKLIATL